MNLALKLIMKLINLKFLLGIFFVFTLTIEAANKVSFSNISELESGNLKIVFNLDKIALINSYALDDPSRIVIDLKEASLKEPIKAKTTARTNELSLWCCWAAQMARWAHNPPIHQPH